MLIFKVSQLLGKPSGAKEEFSLNEPLKPGFLPEIKKTIPLNGELTLMRIPEGVAAMTENLKLEIPFTCSHCLKEYLEKIQIPEAEREFSLKKPQDQADQDDVYLINSRDLTIDLSEMISQEIVLHFPLIPLCSKGCKGLCKRCGTDLNSGSCQCPTETTPPKDTHKPFQNLKKLL